MEERLNARTKPQPNAHGGIYVDEAQDDVLEGSGFWSNAEYYKTVRGDT